MPAGLPLSAPEHRPGAQSGLMPHQHLGTVLGSAGGDASISTRVLCWDSVLGGMTPSLFYSSLFFFTVPMYQGSNKALSL